MDWKQRIAGIAPTVATALAGPLGGAAVAAIGSILGQDNPTVKSVAEAITSGRLTPEHIVEIKKLELQYQNDEKERGFKYAELAFRDRDSARQRETKMGDKVNRNLAYIVVGSFLALIAATLLGYAKVESVLAGTLVGYLSAKAEQVLAYYFGSSAGSEKKSELLAQAQPFK